MFMNLYFVLACTSNRSIDIMYELQKDDIGKVDFWLFFMFIGNVLSLISMITLLISEPGYTQQYKIEDEDNVIDKLTEEFENSESVNHVTQLE